jgi:hypothetical protein
MMACRSLETSVPALRKGDEFVDRNLPTKIVIEGPEYSHLKIRNSSSRYT